MAYINQPADLRIMFADLDNRLRKLETAVRFTAPNYDFSGGNPQNPRVGDIFYDTNADMMKYWDGANWYELADNHYATTLTSFTSTWSGTGLTYTGTPTTARYVRLGKMIFYTVNVNCTNVTNFGTGQYSLTLPTGLNPAFDAQHLGGLHKGTDHYTLLADLEAGTNSFKLYHPTANGAQDIFSYNKPTTVTTATTWYVSGSYFIA